MKHSITCGACKKKFTNRQGRRRKYCLECSKHLEPLKGRDRNRALVRIRDKQTCQKCFKKWKTWMRRFDVHHKNGLCGKKSHGYDNVLEIGGLTTLCHRCHITLHSTRKKVRESLAHTNKEHYQEKIDATKILLKAGFTQHAIARITGVKQPTISKLSHV